ncbi:unnamed protein product, partial [Ectocarpus sp. 12 AP-2014]
MCARSNAYMPATKPLRTCVPPPSHTLRLSIVEYQGITPAAFAFDLAEPPYIRHWMPSREFSRAQPSSEGDQQLSGRRHGTPKTRGDDTSTRVQRGAQSYAYADLSLLKKIVE